MRPAFKVRLFKQTILSIAIVHVLTGEKNSSPFRTMSTACIEASQTDAHTIHFRHSLPDTCFMKRGSISFKDQPSPAVWLGSVLHELRIFVVFQNTLVFTQCI